MVALMLRLLILTKDKPAMTRYEVCLAQRVSEEATVYVEADSREAAIAAADELVATGRVAWSFLEAPDPHEVLRVRKSPVATLNA